MEHINRSNSAEVGFFSFVDLKMMHHKSQVLRSQVKLSRHVLLGRFTHLFFICLSTFHEINKYNDMGVSQSISYQKGLKCTSEYLLFQNLK